MSKSAAQKLAQQKYDQKTYDQILLKVKKGKREKYKTAADSLGLGQMEMIRTAIEEFIERHAGEDWTAGVSANRAPAAASGLLTADERRLLDDFKLMPAEGQKQIRGLIRFIVKATAQVEEKNEKEETTVTFEDSD